MGLARASVRPCRPRISTRGTDPGWGELPSSEEGHRPASSRQPPPARSPCWSCSGSTTFRTFPTGRSPRPALAIPFVLSAPAISTPRWGATVVLPLTADGEAPHGRPTIEGRVSRLAAKVRRQRCVGAVDHCHRDRRRLGNSLRFLDPRVLDHESPCRAGYSGGRALLQTPIAGMGLASTRQGLDRRTSSTDRSDPTPGITSVFEQGAPIRVGTGEPVGGPATEVEDVADGPLWGDVAATR